MAQVSYLPLFRATYPVLAKAQKPGGVVVATTVHASDVPNKAPVVPALDWTHTFDLPDGTRPSVALDFVGQQYFDGVNTSTSLDAVVSGGALVSAEGLLGDRVDLRLQGEALAAFTARYPRSDDAA